MHIAPGVDADSSQNAGSSTLNHRASKHVGHVRPGYDHKHYDCSDKQQIGVQVDHGIQMLPITAHVRANIHDAIAS